jgi:hypothetical protein
LAAIASANLFFFFFTSVAGFDADAAALFSSSSSQLSYEQTKYKNQSKIHFDIVQTFHLDFQTFLNEKNGHV